ncbi:MAG: cell division protein FtsI [Candidatus Xenolissoclinum pacificiensis L6]|uniref:Cell division protein FtsI n=1 Tax=Candidatus Xenolissoclinum pacificiensis L6 TaxID=1401685 RepID=W2V1E2_9RICK|nr:MAG: cell division protein FtsI [Candidatus Xenolissoclinum pacificiensis L6]
MYVLQIVNCEKYSAMSYRNKTRVLGIDSLRGIIQDCNGLVIADNRMHYRVICYPNKLGNKQEFLTTLFDVLPEMLTHQEWTENSIYNNNRSSFVLIKHADWSTVIKIEMHFSEEKGIEVEKMYKRFYPYSGLCAHILGYLSKSDPKKHENQYIGKAGVEYIYDDGLQGVTGKIKYEVNHKGRIIKEVENIPPIPGKTLNLSIDILLTQYVYRCLQLQKRYKSASVVIIDAQSGEIKSLVSIPSYDNNLFSNSINNTEWKSLETSLFHRAVALRVAPGSTFKLITALLALEQGIIDPNNTLSYCRGKVLIGDRYFKCWKHSGHGYVNLDRALASSCNIYFYDLAKKVNVDNLLSIAGCFHVHKNKSAIGLIEELGSVIPDKLWRMQYLNDSWYLGDTVNLLIGHGYILTTPLQLAIMTARIASGKEIIPSVLQNNNSNKLVPIEVLETNLNIIRKAMYNSVNAPYGTAYDCRLKSIDFAGKTGTVQIFSSHNKDIKGSLPYHSLFIGYAPYFNPRYAVSIVLERGGFGKQSAFVANRIFNYMYQKGYFN